MCKSQHVHSLLSLLLRGEDDCLVSGTSWNYRGVTNPIFSVINSERLLKLIWETFACTIVTPGII